MGRHAAPASPLSLPTARRQFCCQRSQRLSSAGLETPVIDTAGARQHAMGEGREAPSTDSTVFVGTTFHHRCSFPRGVWMVATCGDFERPPPRLWTQRPPKIRRSSIFLGRIVGAMFMRVNSKCADQWAGYGGARPAVNPSRLLTGQSGRVRGIRIPAVSLSPWIPSRIDANVSVRKER